MEDHALKLTRCRLCKSEDIHKVVDLGFHPLADTFLPEHLQLGPEVSYPLHLGSCRSCGHVFTLYPVAPEDRYQKQDYSYDSSNSKVAIGHFKEFCEAVLAYAKPASDALVVDIGSNVGTLLSHFQNAGYGNVLGIEPSHNIARHAVQNGVPTLNEFFDAKAAAGISRAGQIEVLLSSNVVNHADDLPALLETAQSVLSPSGSFVFEVPYLLDLIQRTAFDTIYHEHVHYYGLKPLLACLEREGFSASRVERLEYMCGSIRVYARVGGETSSEVKAMIADEDRAGLYDLSTYESFMDRVRAVKSSVNAYLWKVRMDGGRIIGIGAATKGNTFLNYCRLDSDLIDYIADSSVLKIGKRTPGSHIPIISDDDIGSSATHALILPWNIAQFLIENLAHLNVEFYVPQVDRAQ
ncbi:MAG: class I SAM-dependent methyltransferase [Brevundimonas sp.]|uniref:class I SAM-dependent methyltransferase n=1 Tax=Brevundimonas sp. TaxID=1871086 RepID=UPI002733205B|nr:class I SAM-dependent methyltransferase [Brevundimonas sp.]MDP3655589.1 class I SAM-dependent methyltransferase [Brevundimonas sp.]MDZ4110650.1 class I SAM-dependent methyltransferase [Brevundimonas sp.]